MVMIAPSILSADFTRLGEEIRMAEEAGAEMIHIDVMDGHFVPNITIGQEVVRGIRKCTKRPFDLHLMIEEPDRYIPEFADAGSDIITVHFEACRHLHRTVQLIREMGRKAGVAINPATPTSVLEPILMDIDIVVVMSVNPGFGGQTFIPHSIARMREVKDMAQEKGHELLIEVDGGVKLQNVKSVVDAGADILVMGSGFFKADNYAELLSELRKIVGS